MSISLIRFIGDMLSGTSIAILVSSVSMARPVCYYAKRDQGRPLLFKWTHFSWWALWLLLGQHPGCHCCAERRWFPTPLNHSIYCSHCIHNTSYRGLVHFSNLVGTMPSFSVTIFASGSGTSHRFIAVVLVYPNCWMAA